LKRIALPLLIAALAVAAVAAPAASAGTMTPAKICSTYSKNVTTPKVTGTLTSSNVDPSQAKYATCATAKKVMNRMLSLRIEMPKVTEGFRCTPTVTRTEPDYVNYSCVFKGADTATLIRLEFTAKYDQD
jgi:hypothetical protein